MFVNPDHSPVSDFPDSASEPRKWPFRGFGGHPAIHQHISDAADGVGAAAKAEQPNAVAWPIVVDDELVAVRDVRRNSSTGGRRQDFRDCSSDAGQPARARVSAEPCIVESDLLIGVYVVIRSNTRRAVHFVNVA